MVHPEVYNWLLWPHLLSRPCTLRGAVGWGKPLEESRFTVKGGRCQWNRAHLRQLLMLGAHTAGPPRHRLGFAISSGSESPDADWLWWEESGCGISSRQALCPLGGHPQRVLLRCGLLSLLPVLLCRASTQHGLLSPRMLSVLSDSHEFGD